MASPKMSESECSILTDLSSELSSAPTSPDLKACDIAYPTPACSQTESSCGSGSEMEQRKRRRSNEGMGPRKKRQLEAEIAAERPIRINLKDPESHGSIGNALAKVEYLLKILRKRRKIVVVAGAGISTSAGIPDFRSANGLFNTLREDNKIKGSGKHLFDASVYQTDSSTTSFHDMVCTLSTVVDQAAPTPFHHMLATLAQEGRLLRLYTQNVDGLDAGMPPLATEIPLPRKGPYPRTVQLHGSLKKMVCVKCRELRDFDRALFDGPDPPACSTCVELDRVRTESAGKRSHGVGRLRPRMVLYNEQNPDDEAIGGIVASDLRARPDAIIVVGTSMEIPGVKRIVREMCAAIRTRKDGKCIWLNRRPPPIAREFDDCWDLIVSGDCDQVATLANLQPWNQLNCGDLKKTNNVISSDTEQVRKESDVRVVVPSATRDEPRQRTPPLLHPLGILTPETTPQMRQQNMPEKTEHFGGLDKPIMLKLGPDRGKAPKKDKNTRPGPKKKPSTKPHKAKIIEQSAAAFSAFPVTKANRPQINTTKEKDPAATVSLASADGSSGT